MGSWDEQHRLRLRAERARTLLQQLWGDEEPPGPNPELTTLLDAIAGDDDHARQDHFVSAGDGLSYELLASLVRQAGPVAARGLPLPATLSTRLRALGLLEDDVRTAPPEAAGIWELDSATGTVAYDDVSARLIGAGPTAGSASVEGHLTTLIHPEDCAAVAQGMRESLASGAPYNIRFRAFAPGGGTTWLLSRGQVLHHPGGSSPRLAGVISVDSARAPEAAQPGPVPGR